MKQITIAGMMILLLASCSMQKQASNVVGRTDDVYFTANDTRKKEVVVTPKAAQRNLQDQNYNSNEQSNAGNYTNTYSNRLRHFGSNRRFNYNNYI